MKKNTSKIGRFFSFFEIVTSEFSHFLQKNIFFCHQKVSKNFEK